MITPSVRQPISFRWKTELVEHLRELAKASNRSLSNYVENLVLEHLSVPNAQTQAAMEEARAGISAGKADISNLDTFIQSCSE